MAQVFLSYDREDGARARVIAQALEGAGHEVWWDRHIKGGAQYSKEIEQALKAAQAVVVLWSERSVDSAWVRDEAAAGRDTGRLVPVRLDSTEPPLGFRQFQTIDLRRGRLGRGQRVGLIGAVEAVVGGPASVSPSQGAARPARRLPVRLIAAIVALAVLAAVLLAWRPWANRGELVLAIGAASSDQGSQALARDLALKLGAMQTSAVMPVRLVEVSDADDADLMLAAAATGPASATLALKSAGDLAILWSQDFEQPSGTRADLLLQLALTSGRITTCAVEALTGPTRLKPATLKIYLNACAQLAETGIVEPEMPTLLLTQVLKDSPRFTPAWSKLLLAESEMANPEFAQGRVDPAIVASVRRHIAEARKIDPDLPEATIAEAQLLAATDFAGRTERIARAARLKPDDPVIMTILASSRSETGRLGEAIVTARRAVQFDPLSPGAHSTLIALLAYSGALESAKRELAKAEKLWPGTAIVRDAQYRFHLRYGDPRIALAMFDQQNDAGGRGPRLFLQARLDPSPQKVEAFISFVQDRLRNMENPSAGIGFATLAFGHYGRKEELFSLLLSWPSVSDLAIISEVLFRPEFADTRRDPRFLQIAKRAGLLDYWRQSGNWPDFCFAEGHTYDCKAEAAKLS